MLYDQFKAKAEAVSAEVYRFSDRNAALSWLVDFLKREGMGDTPETAALWASGPFLTGGERQQLTSGSGISFVVTQEMAAQARFGINLMAWALADTGTLADNSTDIDQRLVSSLPTIHIALVPTAGILPDMPSLFTRLHPRDCSYLAMITGPSRTADIERVLTIGVHGPERLVILCIDAFEGGK